MTDNLQPPVEAADLTPLQARPVESQVAASNGGDI